MKIEIKNRFTGDIFLCGEYESVCDCLEKNRRADLSGADLSGAKYIINDKEILVNKYICSIQEKYSITIFDTVIKIGCQTHEAKKWFTFKDDVIAKMDLAALEWWKVWKPIIKKIWSNGCTK
jgi:hypothetical protein